MKRLFIKVQFLFLTVLLLTTLSSCRNKKEFDFKLDLSQKVNLTIIGDLDNFEGLDAVILKFEEKYPNCTVTYIAVDNYQKNAVTRLNNPNVVTDLFLMPSSDNLTDDFYLNLENLADYNSTGIDISTLNRNVTDSCYAENGYLYSIPIAADYRGFVVNRTLLNSLGLKLPTKRQEFYDVCDKLIKAGYNPLEGFKGTLGNHTSYSLIANSVAHSKDQKAKLDSINNLEPGSSELFREGFQIVQEFVERGYWTEKSYENIKDSYDSAIMNFLKGDVAFTPIATAGFSGIKKRESKSPDFTANPFEYEFICPPTGVDGTYGYASIWKTIAIPLTSPNLNWANCFLSFLCQKENMILLAGSRGMPANIDGITTDKRFDSVHAIQTQQPDHFAGVSLFTLKNGTYSIISDCLKKIEKPLDDKEHLNPDEACLYYEVCIAEKRSKMVE